MYTYEEYRRIAEEKDEEIKNRNKNLKEKIENAIKELNNVKEENEAIKKKVAEMLKETDGLKKPFLNLIGALREPEWVGFTRKRLSLK